jgi:hypothetical protein
MRWIVPLLARGGHNPSNAVTTKRRTKSGSEKNVGARGTAYEGRFRGCGGRRRSMLLPSSDARGRSGGSSQARARIKSRRGGGLESRLALASYKSRPTKALAPPLMARFGGLIGEAGGSFQGVGVCSGLGLGSERGKGRVGVQTLHRARRQNANYEYMISK